jgi:hypothetical protein
MVGGIVKEIIPTSDKIYINCADTHENGTDYCAVYVETSAYSKKIQIGDSLWWQSNIVLWTPQTKVVQDFRLKKLGYSGVSKPVIKSMQSEEENL